MLVGMKNLRVLLVSAVFGGALVSVKSQPARDVSEQVRVFSAPVATGPAAVAATTKGKVEVSTDGKNFVPITPKQILTEGMTVKTGRDGQADIYFRRTGVALRLRETGELKITKMEQTSTNGAVKTSTELALERGKALAMTGSPWTGPFEIRSSKGIKVAPSKADGRYVVTAGNAKGTKSINLANMPATARGSAATREKGKGRRRDEVVSGFLEADELQSLADEWTASDEVPKKD